MSLVGFSALEKNWVSSKACPSPNILQFPDLRHYLVDRRRQSFGAKQLCHRRRQNLVDCVTVFQGKIWSLGGHKQWELLTQWLTQHPRTMCPFVFLTHPIPQSVGTIFNALHIPYYFHLLRARGKGGELPQPWCTSHRKFEYWSPPKHSYSFLTHFSNR